VVALEAVAADRDVERNVALEAVVDRVKTKSKDV